MQELFCQRRFGFRFMDSMEDVFRKRQRVEHESEAVDKKFEIFMGPSDDLNRARQILSPFLVWLENHSPEAYAFELVGGRWSATSRAARSRPPSSTSSAPPRRRWRASSRRRPSSAGPAGPASDRSWPSQNGSASSSSVATAQSAAAARSASTSYSPVATPTTRDRHRAPPRRRAGCRRSRSSRPVERRRAIRAARSSAPADVDARVRVRAVAAEASSGSGRRGRASCARRARCCR